MCIFDISNKQTEIMTTFNFTPSTISDIKDAYNSRHEFGLLRSDWINLVDPETMQEVKNIYRIASSIDGSISLYNVFCKALKK